MQTMNNKVANAIRSIRKAAGLAQTYSGKPLYLGFSGGKDSLVVYDLARRVGCLFCPMKSGAERLRDMVENPHLAARLLDAAEAVCRPRFPDGATYLRWWLSGKSVEEFKAEESYSLPLELPPSLIDTIKAGRAK